MVSNVINRKNLHLEIYTEYELNNSDQTLCLYLFEADDEKFYLSDMEVIREIVSELNLDEKIVFASIEKFGLNSNGKSIFAEVTLDSLGKVLENFYKFVDYLNI